jgi:polyhydroxyalkanoate synthase subunit PhaC
MRELLEPWLRGRPVHEGGDAPPLLAPTSRQTVFSDASARLYRFQPPADAAPNANRTRAAVLLVPSLINRWYVLDLRKGSSLAQALVEAGHDVYLLDWGTPGDEDRYLTWDDVLARLGRAVRVVRRMHGAPPALLGYCVGGTLSGIYAALFPQAVAAVVNLAGPFDFTHAGMLGTFADQRWFDASAMASAGNISGLQLQQGFTALRPTAQLGKWLGFFERLNDVEAREAFTALETWANDNVAFPAAAYATYISELYQKNALVRGEHAALGQVVDLKRIEAPVLTIGAERDTICPVPAARALNEHAGSKVSDVLVVPGGHVGAVVGSRATRELYPKVAAWLGQHAAPHKGS